MSQPTREQVELRLRHYRHIGDDIGAALAEDWLAVRKIAQAWVDDAPEDWGGETQAACGRTILESVGGGGQ